MQQTYSRQLEESRHPVTIGEEPNQNNLRTKSSEVEENYAYVHTPRTPTNLIESSGEERILAEEQHSTKLVYNAQEPTEPSREENASDE